MRANGPIRTALIILAIALVFYLLARPLLITQHITSLEGSLAVLAICFGILLFAQPPQLSFPIVVPLFLFLLWVATSSLWAYSTIESLKDVTGLIAISIAALVLVASVRVEVIIAGVALGALVILAVSALVVLVKPDVGLVPDVYEHGSFRGVFGQRNALAHVLLAGLPAVLALRLPMPRLPELMLKLLFACALGWGIVAAKSSTSIAVGAAVVGVWVLLQLLRWFRDRGWRIAIVAACTATLAAVAAALVFADDLLALLGRDSNLTGRAAIWDIVQQLISRRPIIGYGWNWVWPPLAGYSKEVAEQFGGPLGHSHSEYLNWWLTTGNVGLILLVILLAFAVVTGVVVAWRHKEPQYLWLPLVLVMTIGREYAEISETRAFGWFLLVLVVGIAAVQLSNASPRWVPRWLVFTGGAGRGPGKHSGVSAG